MMILQAAKGNQEFLMLLNKRKNKINLRANHKSKLPHKQPQLHLILKRNHTKNRKIALHLSPQLVMKS